MKSLMLMPFDVVVVPFPFTDRHSTKRRPALVLSSAAFNSATQNSVMAMITSAGQSSWMGDLEIADLSAAGLSSPCVIRLKLFTLDHRLVLRKSGALSAADEKALQAAWEGLCVV